MYPKLRQKYEQPAHSSVQKVQPGTTYSERIQHRTENPDITTQHTKDMTTTKYDERTRKSNGTMMNLVSILINKLSHGPAN